jgi:hypothetical protein
MAKDLLAAALLALMALAVLFGLGLATDVLFR